MEPFLLVKTFIWIQEGSCDRNRSAHFFLQHCIPSNFIYTDIQRSKYPDFKSRDIFMQKSKFLAIKISRYPDFQISCFLDIQFSSYPDFQRSGYADIQISRFPVFQLFSFLVIQFSSYPIFQLSSFPVIQFSSYPDFQLSSFLAQGLFNQ